MAPAVRLALVLLSPISWPLGKLLDRLLGAGKPGTLGRRQLSALVEVHRSDTGLGGSLSLDEVRWRWLGALAEVLLMPDDDGLIPNVGDEE